jgi:hypothetical protein
MGLAIRGLGPDVARGPSIGQRCVMLLGENMTSRMKCTEIHTRK